ncbi:calcineurin-binding protein cabin-1-like isoform X2 [Photinus pyralis]|uniref:calcineurin-binding protein cabin-1-like isoform X2 n=1 Tax=Photinus pyralis TaxID=7054 RepID=UPI00126729F5|nr:calcineurin-binding protein cabin-1-like isoform X2 [Photinus pyralis]
MLKIRPLNRESLSDEDAPSIRKEAQEENALDLYNSALRLQCNKNYEEAEALLNQLLQENIPQLESQGGLPKTMSTLKYSCYTNLGNISKERNNLDSALTNYSAAAELDGTDVTLWYKIGTLALRRDRFRHAAFAFSQGLECSESHWPCLDKLITLLFAIRDTVGCLSYITKALILDPDYGRGLVLRREIYEANSATREYYRLYNPDYILEPDLDVEIDEAYRKECMQEVGQLCDRINEVEKALESKPLPCISLPTPLESFTWIALGRTVVDVHLYITENNMSHFCKVDLTKCMSQTSVTKGDLPEEPKSETVPMDTEHVVEEVIDVDNNPERRMSVNSEGNGYVTDSGVENVTSSQAEDNDEIDQDTEDQEENVEQKTFKKRGTKRRRDLLLDLQIWGWHSKRKAVKKGKSEKDLTIEDALKRIIPASLMPNALKVQKSKSTEISMNTVDMYKLLIGEPNMTPSSVKDREYFGSQAEKDDVLQFWTMEWECCDAVSLIEQFVKALAIRWSYKWPFELVSIYLEAYQMFREHFDHPQLYGGLSTIRELKEDALVSLLYNELIFYNKQSDPSEGVRPTTLGQLQLLSAWDEHWGDECASFYVRVHWLRAHIFRKNHENALAVRFLQLVQEMIMKEEEDKKTTYEIRFYNYDKYVYINLEITEKLLQHLEIIDSLSHLEHLYNAKSYREVTNILQATFVCIGNPPTFGRMGRPAQLGMLMDSLWFLDKAECFLWSEKCFQEAVERFTNPPKDADKWELVLKKCLEMMHDVIKTETVAIIDVLPPEQNVRLIENLCRTVCFQLNSERAGIPLGTILPWMVLHFVLLRQEHREQAKKSVSHIRKKRKPNFPDDAGEGEERELPPSINVLFSAHDFLGRKSWCLTSQGELLHFIIDTILDRLDTPIFEPLRERIDIHLEQAFFCLYQHPSKKNKVSRHLADHNVNPLPLVWERAQQLYEFFCPDVLPEFDSYKSLSILSDVEQLLQRIIALVPGKCDPQPLVPKTSDFVHGHCDELPNPMGFPNKIRAAYYLLGDYYFKQNEIGRSVKYFLLDLCVNPLRLDTWADLALGIGSQLENKLNHCERFKNENDFFDKAKSACVCFKKALEIAPKHITLWIEFGAFEYMAHSFCSRLLKYDSDTFSIEKFEILENKKENYLESAGNSFTKALDLYRPEQTEADERWLHNYMIGKVAEKRRKEPVEYLQNYLTAAALLNENNAIYPDKINYHNPQHLSIEALEIHYRIHASILKYLELHEGKSVTTVIGKMLKKCLDTCKLYETTTHFAGDTAEKQEGDDMAVIVKCVEDMLAQVVKMQDGEPKAPDVEKSIDEATTSSSSDSSDSDSDSDDSSSSSSSTSSETSPHLSNSDILNLVDRCIVGLEQCVIRFPQNYKALYRLVHLHFHYKARKDLSKCRHLLLHEYKCKNGAVVSGLFSDRKLNNFFNGVWRIPSSEIDRPGSLSAHMARCVTILLQVLRQSNDHKTLLDVCLQLRRIPDADKVYIRHNEREQLSEQALSLCVQALREQVKSTNSTGSLQRLLMDIFRSYQRIQKHVPSKEATFAAMLGEVYKKTLVEKLPENVSVLDLAVKHCQQHKAAEKLKQQKQPPPPPPPPVVSGAPVVLPAPSTVTANTQPMKRPPIGRPRGRPPGPKQPGLMRTSRGRGSSSAPNSSAWQKMMYEQKSMKYMLDYQEELMRQYNTLAKMTFQNQFNQYTHPTSQPSLLNPSQLVQTMSQMSAGINPLAISQFAQSLSNLNPNLLKKIIDQCSPSFNANLASWLGSDTLKQKSTPTPSTSQPKPTYTMAGFGSHFQPSTSKQESLKTKTEDRKLPGDFKAAASMFAERPNITIIPVTQANAPPPPPQPYATTGKTLQEKLADKQKQHTIKKNLEKGKRVQPTNFSSPSSIPHVNLPTFSLDSGVSITQVGTQLDQRASGNTKQKTQPKTAPVSDLSLPPNLPMEVSVIKAGRNENKESSDDDVIIIE